MEKEKNQDLPVFITISEVAEMFSISKSTAYEFARKGKIPSIKIGRFVRFRLDLIQEIGKEP